MQKKIYKKHVNFFLHTPDALFIRSNVVLCDGRKTSLNWKIVHKAMWKDKKNENDHYPMWHLQEQMTRSDSCRWVDGSGGVDRLLNKINDK